MKEKSATTKHVGAKKSAKKLTKPKMIDAMSKAFILGKVDKRYHSEFASLKKDQIVAKMGWNAENVAELYAKFQAQKH
jgi:hypothetical protein